MLNDAELIDQIRHELTAELAGLEPSRDVARQAWETAHRAPVIASAPMSDAASKRRVWRPSGAMIAAAASVIVAVVIFRRRRRDAQPTPPHRHCPAS